MLKAQYKQITVFLIGELEYNHHFSFLTLNISFFDFNFLVYKDNLFINQLYFMLIWLIYVNIK